MQWIFLVVALVVIYYFVILKPGRLDFWKLASKYPDHAFDLFQQQDCWHVFLEKPESGYKSEILSGEWDGPFMLAIPKLGDKVITVYGKIPEYQKSQQEFIDSMKGIS